MHSFIYINSIDSSSTSSSNYYKVYFATFIVIDIIVVVYTDILSALLRLHNSPLLDTGATVYCYLKAGGST